MPMDYLIDADAGVLHATPHGRVTLAEIRSFAAATVADPLYSPDLVEVVDATALTDPEVATTFFDAAQLLTQVLTEVFVTRRVRARAIVAPTTMLHDLARHYVEETTRSGILMRVFHDVPTAHAWAHHVAAQPIDPAEA